MSRGWRILQSDGVHSGAYRGHMHMRVSGPIPGTNSGSESYPNVEPIPGCVSRPILYWSIGRSVRRARADMYANVRVYECHTGYLCSWTVCISVRACCTWGTHSAYQLVVESASPEHRNSYLEGNSDQAAPVVRPISRVTELSWPLHATLPTSLMHA